MIKKLTRLQINDITETKKRMGTREFSEAELKLVTGGMQEECTSGTGSSDNDDA